MDKGTQSALSDSKESCRGHGKKESRDRSQGEGLGKPPPTTARHRVVIANIPKGAQALEEPPPQKPRTGSSHNPQKRKRPTTNEAPLTGSDIDVLHSSDSDNGNDNDAPESVSTKTKSTLPEAPTARHKHDEPRPKRVASMCHAFVSCGKCPRGDRCSFRHEEWLGPKKKERKIENDVRKTLYQLVCYFSFNYFL